jgi:hypothetical protein
LEIAIASGIWIDAGRCGMAAPQTAVCVCLLIHPQHPQHPPRQRGTAKASMM